MKDLAKAVVGICAIALIVLEALNHDMNGDISRIGILVIGGVVLGADAVITWLENRSAKAQGE